MSATSIMANVSKGEKATLTHASPTYISPMGDKLVAIDCAAEVRHLFLKSTHRPMVAVGFSSMIEWPGAWNDVLRDIRGGR